MGRIMIEMQLAEMAEALKQHQQFQASYHRMTERRIEELEERVRVLEGKLGVASPRAEMEVVGAGDPVKALEEMAEEKTDNEATE